ncbi:MAG: alternative ribosome rescue aminoacyl-tRNA hydrolase ArfB [Acidimicrobiia bacterium]
MPGFLRVDAACRIPLDELEWRYTASGGPGGQHANTSNTRVEVRFDVAASRSLTPSQRRRLLDRAGRVVRAVGGEQRSQARNREVALDRLRAKLHDALRVRRPRRPTAPRPAAVERRLEAKRRVAERKRERRRRADED